MNYFSNVKVILCNDRRGTRLYIPCHVRGIGKPEPLKYLAAGVWSRRLTQEHRLVYLVRDDHIDFLQTRNNY